MYTHKDKGILLFMDIGQHSPINIQQILVEQQSSQVIPGEKIEQISSDVQFLQEEMKNFCITQLLATQEKKDH